MKNLYFIVFIFAFAKAYSQQPQKGTVIPEFGPVYEVSDPYLKTNTEAHFKAVFEVASAPTDPSQRNKSIETVARYLNMHAAAGVPVDHIKARIALHGPAAYGVLKNEFYKEKYGVDNPNIALLQALNQAGVEVILCGQTAGARNLGSDRRIPEIKDALSAMTTIIQSQQEGYSLIAF